MNICTYDLFSQIEKWADIVRNVYGHKVYRLSIGNVHNHSIVDFIHINHWFFGNSLVSSPFADAGGFRKNQPISHQKKILFEILHLAQLINTPNIELRMSRSLDWLTSDYLKNIKNQLKDIDKEITLSVKTDKVRMVLALPETSEILMKGFKSKLRSQIRRPKKEGMYYKIGKDELIDDFYHVFKINMRDLGSPVHSRKLFEHIIQKINSSDVLVVYKKNTPVAGSIVIGHDSVLFNPWASSLKEYRSSSPNMLLYWAMLKNAIDKRYKYFDFGRSTPGEGTHAFKEQWGAKPEPLYWYTIQLRSGAKTFLDKQEKSDDGFGLLVKIWQQLPVSVASFIGPWIRKYISL